jgi:hypothetical protein
VSCKATILNIIARLRFKGSVLDRKKSGKRHLLTEEKLYDIGNWLETGPKKLLRLLALQCGLGKGKAHVGTVAKVTTIKTALVHSLLSPVCTTRIRYWGWFQESVFNGLLGPELMSYSDQTWFILRGYVNSHGNRYWSKENPRSGHEVPLHDLKAGVWCTITVRRVTGPVSLFSRNNIFGTLCEISCHPS